MDFPLDEGRDKEFSRSRNSTAGESFLSLDVSLPPLVISLAPPLRSVDDLVMLKQVKTVLNYTSHDVTKLTEA